MGTESSVTARLMCLRFDASGFSHMPFVGCLAFPWPIKGKVGHPTKGHQKNNPSHNIILEPVASNLEHIAEQRPSSRYPFVLSTRDLGPVPLSPVCNPYYKLFNASNTSSNNELDVGTFHPNQYKPHVLLAHHPS